MGHGSDGGESDEGYSMGNGKMVKRNLEDKGISRRGARQFENFAVLRLIDHDESTIENGFILRTLTSCSHVFIPAVSTIAFAPPDDMPDSLVHKMGEFAERGRPVTKPEVPHPPTQIAVEVLYLLFRTKGNRVVHVFPHRRPTPLLTSWTWSDKYQPSACPSVPDIMEPEAEEVHAFSNV